MAKEMPVYIFNGFLDSGKTTLIKQIISEAVEYQKGKSLIIATEDGEEEYDDIFKEKFKIDVEMISDESLINANYLDALVKKYKPQQIFFELNSFFDFDSFVFPKNFMIYQQITLFDATKFNVYFNNMKQMVNSMVKYSTLTVFNRCDGVDSLAKMRRNIKAFNQECQIAFETNDGRMTTMLDEDLPYDLNSNYINVSDEDYPVWYLDVFDGYKKYFGKTISINVYVRDVSEHSIIVGRQIMTCCEADIQFYGYECLTDEFVKLNSYVNIECEVIHNFSFIANEEVVMLKAKTITELPFVEEKYSSF